MGRVWVVTDSTADIPEELINETGITVVPLTVTNGEQVYRDGVDITKPEFYRMLAAAEKLPITSQPPLGAFLKAYERLTANGDSIVSVHLSSGVSGTYQTAVMAAEMLPEHDITVLDSGTATMGIGWSVLEGARLAQTGAAKKAVIAAVETVAAKTGFIFMVDTLKNLEKGGRIGKAACILGTMLSIKPLLTLEDKVITPRGIVRSRRQGYRRMIEVMKNDIGTKGVKVAVLYNGERDDFQDFIEMIPEAVNCRELIITGVGAIIATYSGHGACGIAWYAVD